MKKSVLILVMIVSAIALLILSGTLIIKYKYEHHLYTQISPCDTTYHYTKFQNIKTVRLTNVSHCTIIPFDSLKLGTRTSIPIAFRNVNDTLFVTGDKKNSQIRIFLPAAVSAFLDNSHVELVGSPLNENLRAINLKIKNSTVTSAPVTSRYRQSFGRVTLQAVGHSKISFGEKDQINHLIIELNKSSLNCKNAVVSESHISTDGYSPVSIEKYKESLQVNSPR